MCYSTLPTVEEEHARRLNNYPRKVGNDICCRWEEEHICPAYDQNGKCAFDHPPHDQVRCLRPPQLAILRAAGAARCVHVWSVCSPVCALSSVCAQIPYLKAQKARSFASSKLSIGLKRCALHSTRCCTVNFRVPSAAVICGWLGVLATVCELSLMQCANWCNARST